MSKSLNSDQSRELAAQIRSSAKAPFENAHAAAIKLKQALYVQGFLVVAAQPQEPREHAWLELEDSIIDPTLPHLQASAGLHYYPAQHLTVKQLKAAVEEANEDYPEDNPLPIYGSSPYAYYGNVMLGGQDYLNAHEQAIAKCQELTQHIAETN